ncbi:MAG: 1-acyl-sn-glycerol-3-phosphate acyltransferase [Acidobacteriota bacterium]|nr:1-acyl-sn-glycerol-3-phosphate acyltransferase [Acidobacteriota bacterium]
MTARPTPPDRRRTTFHFWKTVLVLIPLVAVFTIVLGVASLVASLIDRTGRTSHACARIWSGLILFVSRTRVSVRGTPPPRGTYVYAANHQSIYDIPILFWSIRRQMRIIAKASLGRIPFLGWHLRLAGHLLVDRENPGPGILKRMRRLVADHASLIVFPEGTRSDDGKVARFKGGVFLLAIEHQLPIVPVSVKDSRHVMAKGFVAVRPGGVVVTVHPAVSTAGMTRANARELTERVRAIIEGGAR